MGSVQIPDRLKHIIDRQIARGHATSEEDFVVDALRAYAGHLDTEAEIAAMVDRADADMASGRFVTVASTEDSDAVHERAMARLRLRLPRDIQTP
jgi:Arc/MetJ-type ribon-helix-helix transcriptional regulator